MGERRHTRSRIAIGWVILGSPAHTWQRGKEQQNLECRRSSANLPQTDVGDDDLGTPYGVCGPRESGTAAGWHWLSERQETLLCSATAAASGASVKLSIGFHSGTAVPAVRISNIQQGMMNNKRKY